MGSRCFLLRARKGRGILRGLSVGYRRTIPHGRIRPLGRPSPCLPWSVFRLFGRPRFVVVVRYLQVVLIVSGGLGSLALRSLDIYPPLAGGGLELLLFFAKVLLQAMGVLFQASACR